MPTRPLAVVSSIVLLGTILWGILLIVGGPPPETFAETLAKVSMLSPVFYLTYINAAFFITLPAIALMSLLYGYCKTDLPEWAALMAIVFVPIYGVLNLFAYLSQITLIPSLVQMYQQAETRQIAETLLRLTCQELPGSVVGFFNGLAYAILGIPSIIFGIALCRRGGRALRAGGILLALNGVACILGIIGVLVPIPALQFGVILGGGLFLLALIPLTWAFFAEKNA